MFEFFEKTMATNLMVEANSALSREVKMSTLSEEVSRRLRNTSLELDSSCRLEVLERACVKMKTSGHNEMFIRQAVEQGIRSFDERVGRSRLEMDHPGYQPLYPKAGWRKDLKSKEKALKRGTWFKGDRKSDDWKKLTKTNKRVRKTGFRKAGQLGNPAKPVATVVFVPSTRGGILIKSLKEDEDKMAEMTGFRVKYQEASGSVLVNSFDKDLGKGLHCGRKPCPPCDSSDKRENCRSRNIVYESKCRVCNPESSQVEDADNQSSRNSIPREGIYIVETSRSLHERAIEHVRDAESFSVKSHIIKHWMNTHADLPSPPRMMFSITARYRDCLTRQIGEALRINNTVDNILNSKSEYRNNTIGRLTIEESAWERRERSRVEDEEDKLNKEEVDKFRRLKTTNRMEEMVPGVDDVQPGTYETDEEEFGVDDTHEVIVPSHDDDEDVSSHESKVVDAIRQQEYETDEEEFEDISGPGTGGPCHHYGGGAPHYQINTRACGQSGQSSLQEGSKQIKPHSKQKKKKQSSLSGNQEYNLGYFNLWWNRMLREALKEEAAKKKEKEDNMNSLRLRRLLMNDTHTDQDSVQRPIRRTSKIREGNMKSEKISYERPTLSKFQSANQDSDCQDILLGVGTFEHDDEGGNSGKRLKFSQEIRGGRPEVPSVNVTYEHSQASQHIQDIQDNTTGGDNNSIKTDLGPGLSAGITVDTVLLGALGESESIGNF